MNRKRSAAIVLLVSGLAIFYGASFLGQTEDQSADVITENIHAAGDVFTTTIQSEGIGNILVQVSLPIAPRYKEGAPVVVYVPTFFTPDREGFSGLQGLTEEGFIEVTLMFPGRSDGTGESSEGEDDYGGEKSLQALKDAILFAHDDLSNTEGATLSQLIGLKINKENLGLYAFSHPGIAATNVLARYGKELAFVDYFVGRENPTVDTLSCMELGYWEGKTPIENPIYNYPADYSESEISLDYSTLWYDTGKENPYFDFNHNKVIDDGDFVLGKQVPTLFGKNAYSEALINALADNGALSVESWPTGLITPEEASKWWPERETVENYANLAKTLPSLKVMLLFAREDHVQVLADKPHIHQAYDGFSAAGLWVRLNPDAVYMGTFNLAFEDQPAGSEPDNWGEIGEWAYGGKQATQLAPLAGVSEMADRTYANNWAEDLTAELTE